MSSSRQNPQDGGVTNKSENENSRENLGNDNDVAGWVTVKSSPTVTNKAKGSVRKMRQTNLFKRSIRDPFDVQEVGVFRKSEGTVVRDHKRYRKSAEGRRNARTKAAQGVLALDGVDEQTRILIQSMLIEDKIKLARGTLQK